jgi:signal transduction histidine kinase
MKKPLRVLLVEDSEEDAELVLRELRRGFDVTFERVQTADDMSVALERAWDVIVSDYSMPRFTGPDAYQVLRGKGSDVPFIIASGTIGEDVAIAAMKMGVSDYLLKGKLARLVPAIERELREAESRKARRALEQQLLQSQKMEAIGSLAGGVAHDFNNLLSVILSFTEMLISGTKDDDPARADLVEIKTAAMRAADLTKQLLAFSRRSILQPIVVQLNDIVGNVERMLRRLLGEHIELTVLFHRAMPSGGKLTIETANVELDATYAAAHAGVEPGSYVMLAISDTGSGMSAETQARIFEPFFTTKEKDKGTGLGLSTVFGIVKQSGGHIWLYSEEGRGTTFKLYFPRVDAVATRLSPQPARDALPRGTETILLVEDDDSVRKVVALVLQRQGYHVLVAQTGGDALILCERHTATIHLLLTDVVMPRMGGVEVAERLHALRPNMKVLFMSGYTANAIVHHGVLDSDVSFLPKPIVPESLARKVREVLDQ